ncbi:lytic transglycosylase domain-containing protein [Serpentinicella sp. ANB-PHB4]|uniref:lytic transglycosylase domain-containing protein n=1 Tax=Serpentinicella sp. ANB-PHB4 TaxID=3074076 RepID=UPI0028553E7B|nr:lytic transglycosylase domain-containing protein [Serpentinicella sp. ANB-PHB4]MDR5657870.1 lytic transglycosylase domain-containing protein [Serpentinicella sp. ANB-PHB4]
MVRNYVDQIFAAKISAIEKKIPVKLNITPVERNNFEEILSKHVAQTSTHPSSILQPTTEGRDFDDIINKASVKYNIPSALIKSVIHTESSFNPRAVSHAGAQGLMQLMPGTARGLGVTNVWDPVQNIEGGTKYLRQLMNQYNGDLSLTLAAYNAGPGNVQKYNGIPPFSETQNYVKTVTERYKMYNKK